MTHYRRSPIAWPGTVGPDPLVEQNPYLREDSTYLLREDGEPLLRELDYTVEHPP